MSAVFSALRECDSLVARIERIWNLKPTVVEVSVGYPNPRDDSLLEWLTVPMSRKKAADAIRAARKRGLLIERSTTGYCISGAVHPAWSYA